VTTFCSGNTSSPKAGVADTVVLTSGVIQTILNATDLAWLSPWIGYMTGVITLDVPTYCSINPPADPGLTGADLLGLITLGPGPLTQGAVDKMTQLIERVAWPTFCKCDAGGTPTITSPTQPTDLPSVNPPGQTGYPPTTPCRSTAIFYPSLTSGQNHFGGDITFTATTSGASPVINVTSMAIPFTVTANTPPGPSIKITVQQFNAANVQQQTDNLTVAPGAGGTLYVQRNPLATYIALNYTASVGPSGDSGFSGTVDFYCNGDQPNGAQSPCCAPDPLLLASVQSILQLVTLLQRQTAPFAYVTGPVHSGLSGTGTFSLASSLGLLLNVTVPARAGRDAGTPETVFGCGWLNFATPDGYTERFFVSSDSQVILPKLPGLYTDVGYSFAPDVVVTATELAREP
jgi:hypothetical protein